MNHPSQRNPGNHWWHWLVIAALGLVVLIVPIPAGATPPSDHTFRIEASRFEYNPAVIKVNPGDKVTIELVANDVVHGLYVDSYGIQATADPGESTRLTFIADKQGSFRFRCTSTCGNLHPFMIGKLEVGNNTFLWRAIALTGIALFAGVWKGRQ
jgi:heme/copper-type cytochrome/quinol oxidase subunit 2